MFFWLVFQQDCKRGNADQRCKVTADHTDNRHETETLDHRDRRNKHRDKTHARGQHRIQHGRARPCDGHENRVPHRPLADLLVKPCMELDGIIDAKPYHNRECTKDRHVQFYPCKAHEPHGPDKAECDHYDREKTVTHKRE